MQIEEREPSRLPPSACVDKMDVAEQGGVGHRYVTVDQRADIPDRGDVCVGVPGKGPQADRHQLVEVADSIPRDRAHLVPVIERTIGVDDTDRSLGRGDLDRDRQRLQARGDHPLAVGWERCQPLATMVGMNDTGVGQARRSPPGEHFVIAGDSMKPRLIQPGYDVGRLRPTIDQISGRKQPVGRGIEADMIERDVQRVECAVNVADRKITAPRVQGVADKPLLARLVGTGLRKADRSAHGIAQPVMGLRSVLLAKQ